MCSYLQFHFFIQPMKLSIQVTVNLIFSHKKLFLSYIGRNK